MIHHWQEEEKEAVKKVENMHDLADMALSILARMPQPVVEVCGPLSTGGLGNSKDNIKRYAAAVSILFEEGMTVFDPLPFQEAMVRITNHMDGGEYKTDILDIFYHKVFNSGYIKRAYFLPDWQSSKGATWERNLVSALPIEVIDFPEDLMKKVLEKGI